MIRSGNERRGGCGWRRVRPRAAGRSGTPESRSQLEELRSGEWVAEPGRPGAHTTTGPAAATPRACNHSKIVGVYLDLPQDSVAPAKPALEGRSVRRARSSGGARYGFMPAETSTSRGM